MADFVPDLVKTVRRATLSAMRGCGIFKLARDSNWRRNRLLILCYHGFSLEDEHLWRPDLYMQVGVLQERLDILKRGGYNVLPLGEALHRLQEHTLPPRSVVITFDDGGYDFYARAYPILQAYRFPVTVYLTTYHSDNQRPIFNLVCSYMLWKRRGQILNNGAELGISPLMDLTTEMNRHKIVLQLNHRSETEQLTGAQKDDLAATLAELLDIDYAGLKRKRLIHIMAPNEIAELASKGVDFQLHTHRHREPLEEKLFRKEIEDNRQRIRATANSDPIHFCYPSGIYEQQFLDWLQKEHVVSATTCDVGLVTKDTNKLLLPRFVDTAARTPIEFEGWLTGVGSWLAVRRVATQAYQPPRD